MTFQVCSRNSDGSVFYHRSSLLGISFITILILCLVKYSYPAHQVVMERLTCCGHLIQIKLSLSGYVHYHLNKW